MLRSKTIGSNLSAAQVTSQSWSRSFNIQLRQVFGLQSHYSLGWNPKLRFSERLARSKWGGVRDEEKVKSGTPFRSKPSHPNRHPISNEFIEDRLNLHTGCTKVGAGSGCERSGGLIRAGLADDCGNPNRLTIPLHHV